MSRTAKQRSTQRSQPGSVSKSSPRSPKATSIKPSNAASTVSARPDFGETNRPTLDWALTLGSGPCRKHLWITLTGKRLSITDVETQTLLCVLSPHSFGDLLTWASNHRLGSTKSTLSNSAPIPSSTACSALDSSPTSPTSPPSPHDWLRKLRHFSGH